MNFIKQPYRNLHQLFLVIFVSFCKTIQVVLHQANEENEEIYWAALS